ncbi:MAG: hypothetical protein DIZ77_12110 [endosymbiont of Seepiophila jonesi]|nr:MAG: hypothetical protein DIZ77_12110 [endosymbiont of Seepiophila jonesi]
MDVEAVRAPRHVFQKALEILGKISRYRANIAKTGGITVPRFPGRDITPNEVFSTVVRLRQELTLLLKHQTQEKQKKQHLNNKTSSHVYSAKQLKGMISNLISSTQELNSTVTQISSAIDASNENMATQRIETEQVATAMNQMTATIRGIAQTTSDAAVSATEADNEAKEGQSVVTETIGSIEGLSREIGQATTVIAQLRQQSADIGGVLDVIRGIAEQTNLLALNAAIEAARAGEQGRGFAVVADEVRTLAGRTQESTEEIQAMIERLQNGAQDAVDAMERSGEHVQQTTVRSKKGGESLDMITSSVEKIRDMSMQIASAAEQQGAVAENVNEKVANINQLSEGTKDSSDEVQAANGRLISLGAELRKMTDSFAL